MKKEYQYEIKYEEHIYIGETNESYNKGDRYWILSSSVTGKMSIDKNGDLMACKAEDFLTISDFREGKLNDLGISD